MLQYFTDPVLQAPTIGCMLMCLIGALVGTFAVLRGKSLIGESLSHASYPGVVAAYLCAAVFFADTLQDIAIISSILCGAFFSCLLGILFIDKMEKKFQISSDAALTMTLASFFGVGFLLLSGLQHTYPTLYREIQSYLFGQAATMTSIHVGIYACFAVVVVGVIILLYKPIQVVVFDPLFAELGGLPKKRIDQILFVLLVIAIVVGIRSVGVVLISSMLIFPAVCMRNFTSKLSTLLIGASIFGLTAGFFGVYFSHETSMYFWDQYAKILSFPTGPMIVVFANTLFFAVLLLSPKIGLIPRLFRKVVFFWQCQQENLLKQLWKQSVAQRKNIFSFKEISTFSHMRASLLHILLWQMRRKGWVRPHGAEYELTYAGMLWGRKIVRLHRLWEVYLVEVCKVHKDRVHPSAEEMEHIITKEVEQELEHILGHPILDPHQQPIPRSEEPFLKGTS